MTMKKYLVLTWILIAATVIMKGQTDPPPAVPRQYYNSVGLELTGYPLSLTYARHVILPDKKEVRTFFTLSLPAVKAGFPGLSAAIEINNDFGRHWSVFFGPRLGICNMAFPIIPVIPPPYPISKNKPWGMSDFYLVSAEMSSGFAYRLGRWSIAPITPGFLFSVASNAGDEDGALYIQAALIFHARVSFLF